MWQLHVRQKDTESPGAWPVTDRTTNQGLPHAAFQVFVFLIQQDRLALSASPSESTDGEGNWSTDDLCASHQVPPDTLPSKTSSR